MNKEIKVLDKGFVRLVDVMGNDSAVVQAARVSYGKGTKTLKQDRSLIRHLMRHRHTSPFEMVEFKFHIKLPIFIARQWIRHRTANVNEYSGRYSVMNDDCYIPQLERIQSQSKANKQGSNGEGGLSVSTQMRAQDKLVKGQEQAFKDYNFMLDGEVARETARINLPLSTYTEWYWKIDLHNLLHFLRLRVDSHAQSEIQEYGNAIASIIKDLVPLSYEAFEDYVLNAGTFSHQEMQFLRALMNEFAPPKNLTLKLRKFAEEYLSKESDNEVNEFMNKLKYRD